MKFALLAAVTLAVAAPVVTVPAAANAQVLVGRSHARSAPRVRPRLSPAEIDRLFAAEDEIETLHQQIADLEGLQQSSGALSPELQGQLDAARAKATATQQELDALKAKRDRR